MSSLETKFLCLDAAESIAELIDEEKMHKRHAEDQARPRARDIHRAETSIRALKQALSFVLLERACKENGESSQSMPDVDGYLANRATIA